MGANSIFNIRRLRYNLYIWCLKIYTYETQLFNKIYDWRRKYP